MKIAKLAVSVVGLLMMAGPLIAAADDDEALEQFQDILLGLEERSFESLQKAIDKTDMRNRVLSARQVDANVAQILDTNFWQFVESGFASNLPPPGGKARIKLVDFVFQDGQGKAAIRFSKPNFEFAYQVFDLRHDGRGRLRIVDWFDSTTGQSLSAEIAEELMVQMPTKSATRESISIQNPTDLQLFQVTEIYKASRDKQPPRFFEIYDEFSDPLKREPFIAKNAVSMAYMLQDADRLVQGLTIFVDVYSDQPNFALAISDIHLAIGAYDESYALLNSFHQNFPVKEGALPAKLSALALVTGKPDDAEKYAVEATTDEPDLELGWWSLLRARSTAENYSGAIEALTQLEDTFGQRLDETKLRRDKFRGFIKLVDSQEFKDWRADRP
jgi:tetratricopeptide (TPR) repeat protein